MNDQHIDAVTHVVVPLDGSTTADSALRTGFSVAERLAGDVIAVRALEACDDEAAAAAGLARAVARFRDVAPADTAVLDGDPADAIMTAAGDGGVICMATHGRSGIRRLVLGSVAEEVVRRSPRPVLLVGPSVRQVPLRCEQATLVICCDGSATAERVVAAAAVFARSLDVACWVVEVIGPDEDVAIDAATAPRPRLDAAMARCASHCDALAAVGVNARPKVLFGAPARAIEHFVEQESASFAAVATRAHTGLERFTLGSSASEIVRRAACPVLVATASAEERETRVTS